MKVNELIKQLEALKRQGLGNLPVDLFAGDHNPEQHDEGDGPLHSVEVYTDDRKRTFVALRA